MLQFPWQFCVETGFYLSFPFFFFFGHLCHCNKWIHYTLSDVLSSHQHMGSVLLQRSTEVEITRQRVCAEWWMG